MPCCWELLFARRFSKSLPSYCRVSSNKRWERRWLLSRLSTRSNNLWCHLSIKPSFNSNKILVALPSSCNLTSLLSRHLPPPNQLHRNQLPILVKRKFPKTNKMLEYLKRFTANKKIRAMPQRSTLNPGLIQRRARSTLKRQPPPSQGKRSLPTTPQAISPSKDLKTKPSYSPIVIPPRLKAREI